MFLLQIILDMTNNSVYNQLNKLLKRFNNCTKMRGEVIAAYENERGINMRKILAILLSVSMLICLGSGAVAEGSKELTVYFAFTDDEIPTYIQAFKEDTGIQINYVRLSAGEMVSRVISEQENPQTSVICGGSSIVTAGAVDAGLIEPYISQNIDVVPEAYRDPDGFWTPVTVAAHVFLCNNEWFTTSGMDKPASWDDLLNPDMKDMVMMAHPSTSGVASSMLVNMHQYLGAEACWEYFAKLHEVVPYFCKASSAGPSAVCLGEAAVALCLDADAMKYKIQGYDVDIVYPETTFVDTNVAAIVKNGPAEEAENAKIFIDWMISERAQNLYVTSGSCRMPVNPNAEVADGMQPISNLKVFNQDNAVAIANQKALIAEFMERIDNATTLK